MEKKEEAAKRRAELKLEKQNALEYVEEFKKSNGNNSFIAIRIRDGFIGKELGYNKLQLERAAPRGTLVAMKGKDNDVIIGVSYKVKSDEDVPIIGLANALKNAVDNKEPKVSKKDESLLNFFKTRALCYFYPDEFSHSRGNNPIEYKNYDKIHENRARALKYIGREDLI